MTLWKFIKIVFLNEPLDHLINPWETLWPLMCICVIVSIPTAILTSMLLYRSQVLSLILKLLQ
jgi:hypothetical protein